MANTTQHKCTTCGKAFPSSGKFEGHACVKALQSLSIAELMQLYNLRNGKAAA